MRLTREEALNRADLVDGCPCETCDFWRKGVADLLLAVQAETVQKCCEIVSDQLADYVSTDVVIAIRAAFPCEDAK